jgi:hypothetical protein
MRTWTGRTVFACAAAAVLAMGLSTGVARAGGNPQAPDFRVDPSWPKPLPHKWLMGQVGGIAVDRHDHIWVLQRPRTLTSDEAGATDWVAEICSDGSEPIAGVCPGGGPPDVKVDSYGHPRPYGPLADCCYPAPPVLVFDRAGNLLAAWAGEGLHDPDPRWGWPDANCILPQCEWPAGEHGIYVDGNGNVYIAGNGNGNGSRGSNFNDRGTDGQVLKFAADGTFLMEIGKAGSTSCPDSNDTNGGMNGTPQLCRPADSEVDEDTNELYIADGYSNHRVVVVNADTGMYQRRFGAYGQNPVDDTASGPYAEDRDAGVIPANFRNPVHCVHLTKDGLLYVCDRVNDRIQVFDKMVAGAPCSNPGQTPGVCGFVDEKFLNAETLLNGSVWDLDNSQDREETCLYNPDGSNEWVDIIHRASLDVVATFGTQGRNAGQFHWVHNLAVDSRGNIYTAEVDTGKRAQRFVLHKGPKGCKARGHGHDRNNRRNNDRHGHS